MSARERIRAHAWIAFLVLTSAYFGATFTLAMESSFGSPFPATVSCPQEDSCTPQYYDGAWHIVPDVSHITGTTRQPTCLQLEQEYGDDGLCARH